MNSAGKIESVTTKTSAQTQTAPKRKRHQRTNSGSPRGSASSRTSSFRTSIVVDAETQTDYMDVSDTDISPSYSANSGFQANTKTPSQPQRVVLQEIRDSDDELNNGNIVQLRYLPQYTQPGLYLFLSYFINLLHESLTKEHACVLKLHLVVYLIIV